MRVHRRSLLTLMALAAVAAGCGDLTAGGMGEVQAAAVGDGSPPANSMSPSPSAAHSGESLPGEPSAADSPAGASAAAAARGTLNFTAEVTIVSEMGAPFRLTTAPVTANVRIEGTDVAVLAVRRVPIGTYSTVRLDFTQVSGNVESGLVVNGVPFLGPLTVDLGATGSTTIEAPVNLVVEEAFRSTFVIDLRASTWLPAIELLTRTVPGASFRSAVVVRVQ